jgi:hypothetical protein
VATSLAYEHFGRKKGAGVPGASKKQESLF